MGRAFASVPEQSRRNAFFGDYPVETQLLNLPKALEKEGERLLTLYDRGLNWDDPGGPGLWSSAQWRDFHAAAKHWLDQVRKHLKGEIDFIDQIDPTDREIPQR